ncbi:cysteine dioxygenase family protein [Sneathiella chinensis]|uniref:Cysteine dioxygenase n=1 Tax=Sneathiella chinensis TaxID=349750 RepID=A0ABQ5U275_9PROT|nr:cysteine dioxygenase [Sneathiella chinensis]GLQ05511.1 hypothetical protein GCM10007924_07320 [Sneathiella chinensis]
MMDETKQEIARTVDQIRSKVDGQPVTLALLKEVREALLTLAARKDLFSFDAFPPPEDGDGPNNCLYRLSEDADHRFALYVNVANGRVQSPPHDHTTWAVIAGVHGREENRFYKRVPEGVEQTGGQVVADGTGVCLLPDDLHSIHIEPGQPVLNFHMYGLALEQLPGRNYWSAPNNEWRTFPPHRDIREI